MKSMNFLSKTYTFEGKTLPENMKIDELLKQNHVFPIEKIKKIIKIKEFLRIQTLRPWAASWQARRQAD